MQLIWLIYTFITSIKKIMLITLGGSKINGNQRKKKHIYLQMFILCIYFWSINRSIRVYKCTFKHAYWILPLIYFHIISNNWSNFLFLFLHFSSFYHRLLSKSDGRAILLRCLWAKLCTEEACFKTHSIWMCQCTTTISLCQLFKIL